MDTNFAKIDRIAHSGIEEFKARILQKQFQGRTIEEWAKTLNNLTDEDAHQIMTLGE